MSLCCSARMYAFIVSPILLLVPVGLRFSPVYDKFVSDAKIFAKCWPLVFLLEDVILKGSTSVLQSVRKEESANR